MTSIFTFSLYWLLQILGFPIIVVYFAVRGLGDRRYLRQFGERLGRLPYGQTAPGAIWLHAVSVGEVLSSPELLRRLRAEFPLAPLFVSTTTLAGRAAAEEKLKGLADGVFYAPLDYRFAVRRVLRALRPRAVVVLETEIWPNLYREARRAGCALVLLNARISDRAMPRYRRFRWFFREALGLPQVILAQTDLSARRFVELGAPPERVRVAGNLKYDFSPRDAAPPEAVRALLTRVRPSEIWIAASTMPPAAPGDPDEDEVVLHAFGALAPRHSGLLLILVPRRPERFDAAAELLQRSSLPFLRRSALCEGETLRLPGVLLLDSIGELSSLFSLESVVFMGGTLPQRGGHNILEPAFFGRAVIAGPHMENFPEIAEEFTKAGAVLRIGSPGELASAVERLLEDREARESIGARARAAAEGQRGATARAVAEIRSLYWRTVPRRRAHWVLWPLARLWELGGGLKRRRGLARLERLATPVVSVGGLTVGGSGKSPVVLWLAKQLCAAGLRPAILTRGYRRRRAEDCTVIASGDPAPVALTGDEAQVFVRAAVGPVGISKDRAAAGRLIEQRFAPDVFLLDDGFQHARLHRTADIVVIDALDPFGGEELVPRGRLREPLECLSRADLALVTRVERGQCIDGIEARIRDYNPSAPIFSSRVVLRDWIPAAPPERLAAFCGLGNPESFWQTLAAAGLKPLVRLRFPDHHRYSATDVERLARAARAAGAEALVTTEKDFFNFPDGWERASDGMTLVRAKIDIEIDRGEELLATVRRAIARH